MEKDDIRGWLVRLDERQRTIFNTLSRVENHLVKINGKVDAHELEINKFKTYGTVAVVLVPFCVHYVMKWILG